ncbi:MAG TPA: signal peptidase I [Chthoniobacterales bacterium]
MTLFAPKYAKEAHHIAKNVQRLLRYKRDVLNNGDFERLSAKNDDLFAAARAANKPAIEALTKELDVEIGKVAPMPDHHSWRENCETILVAIVIALGIRAYFLQPFKIPTGSMQPTLNGVIAKRQDTPPPNAVQRAWEKIWNGRTYVNIVSPRDDEVLQLINRPFLWFSQSTQIVMVSGSTYKIPCSPQDTEVQLGIRPGTTVKAGGMLLRANITTGDQVFVDKITYHFRPPQRADVFVFTTANIQALQQRAGVTQTQFYIKRLAALPGDNVRIDQPNLFLNGALATQWPFQRVMSQQNGYQGYTNVEGWPLLSKPDQSLDIPPGGYLALGDNSLNSLDSRYWGPVPEPNLVGRGWFVYWPFGQHFGFVK